MSKGALSVKTTVKAAEDWVSRPSECQTQLVNKFGPDARIEIADIGACDGLSSVRYSRIFPNATFWAFEPLPGNVQQIRFFFERYRLNHHIYPCALSDKNGQTLFWESYGSPGRNRDWDAGNKSGSLLRPTGHIKVHPWCKFRKRIVHECRLDDLLPGTTFHFVHMDVQGAEMAVLRGGEQVFKNTQAFWIEVAKKELYAGQPLKYDIAAYMQIKGYKCVLDTCNGDYGDMFFER